jgi:hypothetical protein
MIRKTQALVVVLLTIALALFVLSGCGGGTPVPGVGGDGDDTEATAAPGGEVLGGSEVTEATGGSGGSAGTAAAGDTGGGAEAAVLEVGQTTDVAWGKLGVSQVTVVTDLASSEADALLLDPKYDRPGANKAKAAGGNEFLLITFTYTKSSDDPAAGRVTPSDLKLADAAGTEYQITTTNGGMGVFNARPEEVAAGAEGTVTAVYEVPTGSTGLVLTYESIDYGADPAVTYTFQVNIR